MHMYMMYTLCMLRNVCCTMHIVWYILYCACYIILMHVNHVVLMHVLPSGYQENHFGSSADEERCYKNNIRRISLQLTKDLTGYELCRMLLLLLILICYYLFVMQLCSVYLCEVLFCLVWTGRSTDSDSSSPSGSPEVTRKKRVWERNGKVKETFMALEDSEESSEDVKKDKKQVKAPRLTMTAIYACLITMATSQVITLPFTFEMDPMNY